MNDDGTIMVWWLTEEERDQCGGMKDGDAPIYLKTLYVNSPVRIRGSYLAVSDEIKDLRVHTWRWNDDYDLGVSPAVGIVFWKRDMPHIPDSGIVKLLATKPTALATKRGGQ